jgi:hypothetical protein
VKVAMKGLANTWKLKLVVSLFKTFKAAALKWLVAFS